jgi:hypothetical protein
MNARHPGLERLADAYGAGYLAVVVVCESLSLSLDRAEALWLWVERTGTLDGLDGADAGAAFLLTQLVASLAIEDEWEAFDAAQAIDAEWKAINDEQGWGA